MSARKSPAWSKAEVAALREHYAAGGMKAAAAALPGRSLYAIRIKAARLKLRSPIIRPARKLVLNGENLAAALEMREAGLPFSRIAARFGVCETAATNAVNAALCEARGHRPAARSASGHLDPKEIERVRYMLKKGVKHIEIQQRMGISAASVSHYRRVYNAELEARGKAPLPPPGNGERYSGVRIDPKDRKRAVALLMTGLGSIKVSEQTGLSKTSVVQIRRKLVKRLKAKGQVLPGCDIDGRRRKLVGQANAIPESTKLRFRGLLLNRMPVARAATVCGIGTCSGYRLRDELRDELAAAGETLPPPRRPGKLTDQARAIRAAEAMSRADRMEMRKLIHAHGEEEGRRLFTERRRTAWAAPKSFEQQLALVAAGAAGLVPAFKPSRALPDQTLGGVASGVL